MNVKLFVQKMYTILYVYSVITNIVSLFIMKPNVTVVDKNFEDIIISKHTGIQ